MKRTIRITPTADAIPDHFGADISIVIDVLRASSVIITALSNGTPFIIPSASIDEAKAYKKEYPHALLAGERNAIKIKNFDRGNSPIEHQANESSQPLILTTTNGTKALKRVANSDEILIASFINLNAIVERLKNNDFLNLHLACAGTNGEFSLDDFLMAGAIVSKLDREQFDLDDLSLAAVKLYKHGHNNLHRCLQDSKHYKTLLSKGFKKDLDYCLRLNTFQTIPEVVDKDSLKLAVRQII